MILFIGLQYGFHSGQVSDELRGSATKVRQKRSVRPCRCARYSGHKKTLHKHGSLRYRAVNVFLDLWGFVRSIYREDSIEDIYQSFLFFVFF